MVTQPVEKYQKGHYEKVKPISGHSKKTRWKRIK